MQLGDIQEFSSHYSLDQSGGRTDRHTAISTAALLAWLKFYLNCVLSLPLWFDDDLITQNSANFCVFHDYTH